MKNLKCKKTCKKISIELVLKTLYSEPHLITPLNIESASYIKDSNNRGVRVTGFGLNPKLWKEEEKKDWESRVKARKDTKLEHLSYCVIERKNNKYIGKEWKI